MVYATSQRTKLHPYFFPYDATLYIPVLVLSPFQNRARLIYKKYTKTYLDDRKLFNWPFEPQTVDRVGLGEWAIVCLSVVTLTV